MSDYQNDYIVKRLGKGPYILEKLTDYIQNQECITCHKLLQSVSFYNHIAGIMLDELNYPIHNGFMLSAGPVAIKMLFGNCALLI